MTDSQITRRAEVRCRLRAGADSLHELARRQSVEDSLREQNEGLLRFIAALVEEAGGELTVAERTLYLQDVSPELVTWADKEARKWHVRIRKSQPPSAANNERGFHT